MQSRLFNIKRMLPVLAALLVLPALPGTVHAQVDLGGPLDRTLDRTLGGGMRPLDDPFGDRRRESGSPLERLGDAGDEVLEEIDVTRLRQRVETGIDGVTDVAGQVTEGLQAAAGGVLRPFVADVDPFGNAIEKNVLVVLIDDRGLAAVRSYGLTVLAERPLPGLGLTLVTLAGPNSHKLAAAALDLRRALPGAAVDFNHIYRETAAAAGDGTDDAGDVVRPAGGALRIGMIDSEVDPEHRALNGRTIVRQDFVRHDGQRPRGHGTAVASLLAGVTPDTAELYSASVFFSLPDHRPGASTESLVAALDWLVAAEADAINMSLAGPANALLERALQHMPADGPAVIAAVGNNGPSGDPMYPAAYETVIGVTAVDRQQRIFRYANRGPHVAFAALGVDVKVADAAGGGWRIESGTSMASPLVAAIVARIRRDGHPDRDGLMSALIAGAEDLGSPGTDDIFGHGLITGAPTIVSSVRTPRRD